MECSKCDRYLIHSSGVFNLLTDQQKTDLQDRLCDGVPSCCEDWREVQG